MTIEHIALEITTLLQAGIQAARDGNKAQARQLLLQVTELDPSQEQAWLWLAGVTPTPQEAVTYLETALALNPHNPQAQEGLRWLQSQLPPTKEPEPDIVPPELPAGEPCLLCGNLMPAAEQQCPTCGHVQTESVEGPEAPPPPDEGLLAPRDIDAPLPGFFLTQDQADEIDAHLERMAYESEARCIILADMTGRLISEQGQAHEMNTQVLSALAAGELAATNEMARLVGEEARFKLLLHEGERRSVYLSDIGGQMLLIIVFDKDTPIGLVRMILKNAVRDLQPIIAQARQADSTAMNEALGSDFAQLLEDELNASLT